MRWNGLTGIGFKSLCFVGLAILFVISTQQATQAQKSEDYQDGYQAGLEAGAADYREGYSKYAYCPDGSSRDYCAGFIVGYNEGYIHICFVAGYNDGCDSVRDVG